MRVIKVGEYIRINDGDIGKLKRIEFDKNDTSLKWYVFDKKEYGTNITKESFINKPYIKSHSPNIIDLIEVGDILTTKLSNGSIADVYQITSEQALDNIKIYLKECSLILESIVTYEQFESMKYIVGGEEK